MRSPIYVPPAASTRARRCAWKHCTRRESVAQWLFCERHYARAVADYMNIKGLTSGEASRRPMTPATLLRAVRACDTRRAEQFRRKQRLRRMCAAAACPGPDTPDAGHSCQTCFSFLPAYGDDACAVTGCGAGRLLRDEFCAWHMRTVFLHGEARCYRCDAPCEAGRFCPPCDALCQYIVDGDGCPAAHAPGVRFCRAHSC